MSQRHATDVISLVFGVIFAGFTVVWCSRSPTPSTRGRPGWSGRSCSWAAGRRPGGSLRPRGGSDDDLPDVDDVSSR